MNHEQAIDALRATGERLAGDVEPVTVVIAGSVAAMVAGELPASRITLDCDVVSAEPEAEWDAVREAARSVAAERGLPTNWLNRDSSMYAHLLPLGWRGRCRDIAAFGPMTVRAISRRDLMGMKLMGAPVRPQDLEDIVAMRPSRDEIVFLHDHLDRLDAESLARETHDAQRTILQGLNAHDEPT